MANQLFDEVFNKASIYEMFFFNVKSVLIYPTLKELAKEPLYYRWINIANTNFADSADEQKTYEDNAPNHPEFCKIVAITYATLYAEKGTLKRYFKKIVSEDEIIVLTQFMDVLHQLSSEGSKSQPIFFPTFCGYNIISNDIPTLIKRFIVNREKFEQNNELPLILKRSLSIKPWESGIIDVMNVWKFNGFDYAPLMLIADFLGLKKTVDLLSQNELSKYYWENITEKPEETLEFMSLQSATQTNLVIQLINELRQL